MRKRREKITKRIKYAISVFICFLSAIFFIANIVVMQNPFLYNAVCSTLGGQERVLKKGDPSKYVYYTGDYKTKTEVLAAANALNAEICEEGIVLLKNEGNTLPLSLGQRITVFGKSSVNLILGGSGSNTGTTNAIQVDVNEVLQDAGFICNPFMRTFYRGTQSGTGRPYLPSIGMKLTGFSTGETPQSAYTNQLRNSYAEYKDAAIVIISRIGGEGFDLPRSMFWDGKSYTNWNATQVVDGARSKEDHYLQLDQNETDMIQEACDNFDNVIVVINSASPIELGFLDDPTHYAYHKNLKAALWLGYTGESGITALGKILNGTVNPSGKTVDTYARNFKNDPTWQNFGNSLQENGNRYTLNGVNKNAYFVEYREGIYTGYRYYETKASYEGAAWYADNVVYPFGYGMSYTEFDYRAIPSLENGANLSADGKLSFTIEVKNVGTLHDGKETVQLYYSAPYTEGGIEKAHIVLGDFVKTELLDANNGAQTVTLEINVRDLASYDYSDKNGNGFKGYEVEPGTYTFYVTKNAHGWREPDVIKFTYTVPAGGFKYEQDNATNHRVENLFDDVSEHVETYLSRENNFKNEDILQGANDAQYRNKSQAFFDSLTYKHEDNTEDPWYTTEMPIQRTKELSYKNTKVQLFQLIGKEYNDSLWTELLNQLTVSQMTELIGSGDYRTLQIENIGKPLTIDADGPMGFVSTDNNAIYDTCYYASACVVGATWNKALAYEMGKMIGNEGLVGDEKGNGMVYSGWYAPAVNLHRSPFGGRNFEYYAEDGLLSGRIAASLVKGANEKGVYTYVKHFALNEQETDRDTTGLITWANEQSMRELYFKPFELCVKEGETKAMMLSFNRIGTVWVGGSYALLTELLREEWGFQGMVITDYNNHGYMNVDQMIRAGGDLNLSPFNTLPKHTDTAIDVTAIRQATKNILYAVANSNAMNGMGEGVVWEYTTPGWVIAMFVLDGLIVLMLVALFTYPYWQKWIRNSEAENIEMPQEENITFSLDK